VSDTVAASTRIGRILGVFDETGRPLDGVDVVDRVGGGTIRTARSGLIGMGALANQHDSAVVTIRKIGFADTTVLVMVGGRDTVPMQIFLRRATALEQVTITARESEHLPFFLKDFEERLNDARWNGAKTFTPAEFRKQEGLRLFDVLYAKHVGIGNRQCLLVYRDGVPWLPPDIERGSAGVPKEDADNFDAAVFYTIAQMPSDLPHTAPSLGFERGGQAKQPGQLCGALLLYSRHKI
jgi:hypothetical protein